MDYNNRMDIHRSGMSKYNMTGMTIVSQQRPQPRRDLPRPVRSPSSTAQRSTSLTPPLPHEASFGGDDQTLNEDIVTPRYNVRPGNIAAPQNPRGPQMAKGNRVCAKVGHLRPNSRNGAGVYGDIVPKKSILPKRMTLSQAQRSSQRGSEKKMNNVYQQQANKQVVNSYLSAGRRRTLSRLSKQSSAESGRQQSDLKEIQCKGQKSQITIRAVQQFPKGIVLNRTPNQNWYEDSRLSSKEDSAGAPFINVDALGVQVEDYQFPDEREDKSSLSETQPHLQTATRRLVSKFGGAGKDLQPVIPPQFTPEGSGREEKNSQNLELSPAFKVEEPVMLLQNLFGLGRDFGAEHCDDQMGLDIDQGVSSTDELEDRVKDKLSALSMVVDKLIWTAQTEDGGPQASELQTANGSLSALESQTNIDGLKFDEEIQKNASFRQFQRINQLLDKVTTALDKKAQSYDLPATGEQRMELFEAPNRGPSHLSSTHNQHRRARYRGVFPEYSDSAQSPLLAGPNSSSHYDSAVFHKQEPSQIGDHAQYKPQRSQLGDSAGFGKIIVSLPNAGEMAQRPKTNEFRPRLHRVNTLAFNSGDQRTGSPCSKEQEEPKASVTFEGHSALLGRDVERRRKAKLRDFPRPAISMSLVTGQTQGQGDAGLLGGLSGGQSGGKYGPGADQTASVGPDMAQREPELVQLSRQKTPLKHERKLYASKISDAKFQHYGNNAFQPSQANRSQTQNSQRLTRHRTPNPASVVSSAKPGGPSEAYGVRALQSTTRTKSGSLSKQHPHLHQRESSVQLTSISSIGKKGLKSSGHFKSSIDIQRSGDDRQLAQNLARHFKNIQSAREDSEAKKVENYLTNFLENMRKRTKASKNADASPSPLPYLKARIGTNPEKDADNPPEQIAGQLKGSSENLHNNKYLQPNKNILFKRAVNETLKSMGNNEKRLIEKWHLNKNSKKQNLIQAIDKPYRAKQQAVSRGGARADASPGPASGAQAASLTVRKNNVPRKTSRRPLQHAEVENAGREVWAVLKGFLGHKCGHSCRPGPEDHSEEVQAGIKSELERQANFDMPESDEANCRMLQSYQQSGGVTKMNATVESLLTSVAGRAAAEAEENTELFSRLGGNLPDLFRKARARITRLNSVLDGVLMEEGAAAGSIQIQIGETTQIAMFDKDEKKYARIAVENKSLPIRLKLFHRLTLEGGEELPEGRKKYHELLPEDLGIFISMNHKEPGFRKCDMAVTNFSVMNQKKQNYIVFGSERGRKLQRFPDEVFLCFVTSVRGCTLEVECAARKSKEDLFEEKRMKILEFKGDANRSILEALEVMSPVSRERKLYQINEQLTQYYLKNAPKEETEERKPARGFATSPTALERSILKLKKSKAPAGLPTAKPKALEASNIPGQSVHDDGNSSLRQEAPRSNQSISDPPLDSSPGLDPSHEDSILAKEDSQSNLQMAPLLSSPLARACLVPKQSQLQDKEALSPFKFCQQLLAQKQLDSQERRNEAQNVRMKALQLFRQATQEHSAHWHHFREQKVVYVDRAEKLLKGWVRVRWLVGLITARTLLRLAKGRYDERRDERRQEMVQAFLAIKFKVRFRCRFERAFGRVQPERFRKVIVRHLTFRSLLTIRTNKEVSAALITTVINIHGANLMFRRKLRQFMARVRKLQKLVRPLLPRILSHYSARIRSIAAREIQDLIAYLSTREPKGRQEATKKPKEAKAQAALAGGRKKALREFNARLNNMIKGPEDGEGGKDGKDGMGLEELSKKVAQGYLELQLLRHALGFQIFKLLHAEVLLEQIEAFRSQDAYEEAIGTHGAACKCTLGECEQRVGKFQQRIQELECDLFYDADIIDAEETYTKTGIVKEESEPPKASWPRWATKAKDKKAVRPGSLDRPQGATAAKQASAQLLRSDSKAGVHLAELLRHFRRRRQLGPAYVVDATDSNVEVSRSREAVARAIIVNEKGINRKYGVQLLLMKLAVNESEYRRQLKEKEDKIEARQDQASGAARDEDEAKEPRVNPPAEAAPREDGRRARRTHQNMLPTFVYPSFRLTVHKQEIHKILFRFSADPK